MRVQKSINSPSATKPHASNAVLASLLGLLLGVPLAGSLLAAAAAGTDPTAWEALAAQPQVLGALGYSVWTGALASALAIAGTACILSAMATAAHPGGRGPALNRWLPALLAVPHAAFAIGVVALLAPSGWFLRALSPWATGMDAPPPWPTTQDPWGLGLITVLALKEIPFLLWAALAHLQRPDVARRLQQELTLAHTMGYSASAAWWRVGWPQLLPRLTAPLLAVLAYSLTVVDVALVIGPTSPPTLAVLAWQWLQDADAATNAQGAAAAWLLAALLALCATLAWAGSRAGIWRRRWTRGLPTASSLDQVHRRYQLNRAPSAGSATALPKSRVATLLVGTLLLAYATVLAALLAGSVTGSWPFPQLLPESLTWAAWQSALSSSRTVATTVWLALASSFAALCWSVAWLELAPRRWQVRAQPLLTLPLVLPAVLWVVGLHRVALAWQLDTTSAGLWLAHTLACVPYVLLALQGPYTGFDTRLGQVAATLGHGPWAFLLRVKWPLLRAALASGFAVGFAVSVAQYLPTLYVGAGRFNTVTTEAVNLSAGGQRSLAAAYAWLQWVLPVLVFALAARLGRARKFQR